MARKGRLEEILSKALHSSGEDPSLYTVAYRDFEEVVEVSLPDFVRISEGFELIPANRVMMVKKGTEVLYRRRGFNAL
jgi:uncharacterized protein (UPF0248 family)